MSTQRYGISLCVFNVMFLELTKECSVPKLLLLVIIMFII